MKTKKNNEMKKKVKSIVTAVTIVAMMMAMVPAYSPVHAASNNNSAMIEVLPTSGISVSMPLQTALVSCTDDKGRFTGYQIFPDVNFQDAKAATKTGIKNKVAELTSGKTSNYEKARAIHDYVQEHMTYEFMSVCLDDAWKYGRGNCESYAALTSAMLYYAGIPNGYAIGSGHIFNVILCNGRWVPSDSQGLFDGNPDTYYPAVEEIIFRSGKLSYIIDDLSGVKLTGVGDDYFTPEQAILKSGITIPDYVTKAYTEWTYCYPNITIRGNKGTAAERAVKGLGYKCVHYSGKQFIAHCSHSTVRTTTKAATYFATGKAINRCKNCSKTVSTSVIAKKKLARPAVSYWGGKKKMTVKFAYTKGATGFQIAYKKEGAKKFTMKNYNSKGSILRTIPKLQQGKYTVKVRAYVKSGSKYAYSTWTPLRPVWVR